MRRVSLCYSIDTVSRPAQCSFGAISACSVDPGRTSLGFGMLRTISAYKCCLPEKLLVQGGLFGGQRLGPGIGGEQGGVVCGGLRRADVGGERPQSRRRTLPMECEVDRLARIVSIDRYWNRKEKSDFRRP